MTHQPRTLYDIMSGGMNLYWDANGNIAEMIHCEQDAGRFHEWDEDNRLRFVLGERFAGYYGYDANGERVYKLTGTCGIDQINLNGTRAYVMFDDAVLYPNPYLVVTPRGYTKHYYAGTERLATAIGSGGFDDMGLTIGHYASREEDIAQMFYANYQNEDPFYYDHILSEMIGTSTIEGDNMPGLEYCQEPIILGRVDVIGGEDLLYSSIYDNLLVRDRERELFFSHSDHLGSANWITDYDGVPIQYLHYAPYGELIDNQQATQYDERYKFTGKERDRETGYDYFGARSYASALLIWLSPDPLSDKYPEISPYAYCHWNPVKYVDKDGRDDLFDESGTYIEHINNGTDYVMIQKMNGEQQNITEFSYSKNELANREMLSNVATYYAAQVNLSQDIGIFDNTTIEEGAFACTLSEKRQVSMVVSNGKLSSLANTGSNIMNAFVHETKHAIDGVKSEIDAILQQIEHPTWSKTTDAFQLGVINYLVKNANLEKLSSDNPSIQQIQSILDQSTYSIYHHKNEFSISLQLK